MLTQAQANLLAKALINGDFGAVASLFAPLVPQTSATIATTYPGTGVAYTNKTNFIQQVVISGGTVTVITLSAGGITGETTGTYLLRPGDSVMVTSSVDPTVFNVTNLF